MNIIKRLLAAHRENAPKVSDDDPLLPGMISRVAYNQMTDVLNTAMSTGKLEPYLDAAIRKANGEEIPVSPEPDLLDSSLDTLLNRVSENAKSSPSSAMTPKTESLTKSTAKKSTAKTASKKTKRKTGSKTASGKPKVKGVTWRKDRNEFEVRVTKNGKRRTIGYRKTQEEAVELKEYWLASQDKQ